MTRLIDRYLISRGVRAEELCAIRGRTVIYLALGGMAGLAIWLSAEIAGKLL